MKKFVLLMCSFVFLFSLVGCNRNTDNNLSSGMSSMENKVSSTLSSAESFVSDGVSNIGSDIQSATDTATNSAKITAQQAKETALNNANLKESDVTGLKVEFENDNGTLKYEVGFSANGKEYDYEIDANSGEIISSDKEND
jgi:uncharacterized membrane protein YkoI